MKNNPQFSNKPNQLVIAINDKGFRSPVITLIIRLFKFLLRVLGIAKEYWISRSPALVAVVLGIYKDNIFVLGEQRSKNMDQPGKWCVPCGYLDWNETGYDGVTRELYEEVGFYLPDYIVSLITDNDQQPFFVQTHPSENRQNVALTYGLVFDFEKTGLPALKTDPKEVTKAEWIPIERVLNKSIYDWAFKHDERIEMALIKYKAYLQ